MRHPEEQMFVSELRDWADSECPNQSPDVIDELLELAGYDPDEENSVWIRWPDHVTVPRPNGDMMIEPHYVTPEEAADIAAKKENRRYVEGSD